MLFDMLSYKNIRNSFTIHLSLSHSVNSKSSGTLDILDMLDQRGKREITWLAVKIYPFKVAWYKPLLQLFTLIYHKMPTYKCNTLFGSSCLLHDLFLHLLWYFFLPGIIVQLYIYISFVVTSLSSS